MNNEETVGLMLPVKERSTRFLTLLSLKNVFNLSDPEHVTIITEAYDAFWPLTSSLRLRKLKANELDLRFIILLEHYILPWHRLVSQHGEAYWDRIKDMAHQTGADFPELHLLRTRRSDLTKAWQEAYKKQPKEE